MGYLWKVSGRAYDALGFPGMARCSRKSSEKFDRAFDDGEDVTSQLTCRPRGGLA